MSAFTRPVWSEGMHLSQHHFQAQARYFEDALHFAVAHLCFAAYGIVGCEMDADALRNGSVRVLAARGLMPDGLPFQFPDGDAVPDAIDAAARFSPLRDSHLVLLTVPAYRPGGANVAGAEGDAGGGGAEDARYLPYAATIADDATGLEPRAVTVARKNFRLHLDGDASPAETVLPLARVRRDGAARFVYDADYVPPALQIGASESLMRRLRRVVDVLEARGDALAPAARDGGAGGGPARDAAQSWLLHAIRSALPPLHHLLHARRLHPERLYTELARLAGALATFTVEGSARAVPRYDHEALDECLAAIETQIRAHLEVALPTTAVTVPLTAGEGYVYTGAVADQRCFGRSRWILGLRSSAGASAVVSGVPQLVKVCSRRFTPELVRRAYPGLRLEHLPTPPSAIGPRLDSQYFAIEKGGPCWDTLVSTREVGVYVPGAAFPDAEPELHIVLEG